MPEKSEKGLSGKIVRTVCWSIGLLGAAYLSLPMRVEAQVITGRVTDLTTEAPIADALVTAEDNLGFHFSARTSSRGYFRIPLIRSRSVLVKVRRLGFQPFSQSTNRIDTGDTLMLSVSLKPVPQQLSAVTIDAELEAAKDLRIVGYNARSIEATFITRSRIEAVGKDARSYSDIVDRLHLLNVNVTDRCVQRVAGERCIPVYVNDWFFSSDPEILQVTKSIVDPNDIDHIVFVRGGPLAGSMHIYTIDYVAKRRANIRKSAKH